MYQSGKSYSQFNPKGIRRKKDGTPMAPRSLRKKGKTFLVECSEKELKKIAKL